MHKTILDRENWNLNPGLIYNLSDLEQFFYSFEFIICKMETTCVELPSIYSKCLKCIC